VSTDEEFLRRFLVHAEALPSDLGAWATALILETLPASARLAHRDRLLRQAAALVQLDTPWERAEELHGHLADLAKAIPAGAPLCTVRGLLADALLLYPGKNLCVRQIYRVLTDKKGSRNVSDYSDSVGS
jgi:hypothetical protein